MREDRALKRLISELPPIKPPDGFHECVLAAIDPESSPAARSAANTRRTRGGH